MRYLAPASHQVEEKMKRYLFVELAMPAITIFKSPGCGELIGLAPSVGTEPSHVWEGEADWVYVKMTLWAGRHMIPA